MNMENKISIFHEFTFSIIFILFVLFTSASCSPLHQVVTETRYNIVDSTVINRIDSVVVTPIYEVKDIVPEYDTLHLSTDLAEAQAYVDTNIHMLKGSIKNKKEQQVKYIYRDRIQVKDSIITEQIPVYVDKIQYKHYKYEKYLWMVCIGLFVFLFIKYILPIIKKIVLKV